MANATYKKTLQLTPRRSLSTEMAIFSPFIPEPRIFIHASITSQWQDQLARVQERLIGLDPMVERAFYDNNATPIEKKGLYNLISHALAKEEKITLSLEVVNNSIVFTNTTNAFNSSTISSSSSPSRIKPYPNPNSTNSSSKNYSSYSTNIQSPLDPSNNTTNTYQDTLVIDGRNNKTPLLYDYYTMIYLYMYYANISLKLANKPIIMLNEMRSQSQSIDRQIIEDDVTDALSMLKHPNGFMILDAKDKVTTPDIDNSTYESYIEKAYRGIASVFKLPLSFVTGQWTAGLGSDDAQAQQVEDVLSQFYKVHYEPILRRIYEILNLDFSKVIYPEFKVVKLKAIAPILQAINQVSYIDDATKLELTKSLVGVDLTITNNNSTINNNTNMSTNNTPIISKNTNTSKPKVKND